jgi:hypothetical protein
MGTELILRHASAELLVNDFEANLRKGRAFVPGARGVAQREHCQLRIEHPERARAFSVRAEAVWIDAGTPGGTGLSFLDFDAAAQDALRAFVIGAGESEPAGAALPPSGAIPTVGPSSSGAGTTPSSRVTVRAAAESGAAFAAIDSDPSSDRDPDLSSPAARNLHDRVRALDLSERELMARQGSLPERVALERRYGSSVWEGLLHNPQVTPREVQRMAKSTSLPTGLVNLIVSNRGWLSDPAINQALLCNPRVSGAHLVRVLRALPQAEIQRVAEQSSVRMQVRQAAKRLIRR